VQNPNDVPLREAINPWQRKSTDPKILANHIDAMCQKCHDQDNSLHFKFEEYWEKMNIAHPNPKPKAAAGNRNK
jgi:hypothetical protein